jgi:hypothetical protein
MKLRGELGRLRWERFICYLNHKRNSSETRKMFRRTDSFQGVSRSPVVTNAERKIIKNRIAPSLKKETFPTSLNPAANEDTKTVTRKCVLQLLRQKFKC